MTFLKVNFNQEDKREHFKWGFFLSIVGIVWCPLIGLGFIAGIAKEVKDYFGDGTPDIADMLATWYGSVLSSVIVLLCLVLL